MSKMYALVSVYGKVCKWIKNNGIIPLRSFTQVLKGLNMIYTTKTSVKLRKGIIPKNKQGYE